jgi:hypothetical protein
MAELQSSKLTVRVRFPSPAPLASIQVGRTSGPPGQPAVYSDWILRATHVPLVCPLAGSLPLILLPDAAVNSVRYLPILLARRVLVHERRSHARLAESVHELLGARAPSGGQGVAGVAEVVEVEAVAEAGGTRGVRPSDGALEVAGTQNRAFLPVKSSALGWLQT